ASPRRRGERRGARAGEGAARARLSPGPRDRLGEGRADRLLRDRPRRAGPRLPPRRGVPSRHGERPPPRRPALPRRRLAYRAARHPRAGPVGRSRGSISCSACSGHAMTAVRTRTRAGSPGASPTRFDLAGGALALLETSHDVPLVSIVIVLRRGCEGFSSEQIDFRIDVLGAEMAVDTSHSTVAVHAQLIARNLDAFVGLVATMLGTPTFPAEELERLKRESVAEIVEARDSDRAVAQKAMQRTLFEGHPYSLSSGGTVPSVQNITREDVVAF